MLGNPESRWRNPESNLFRESRIQRLFRLEISIDLESAMHAGKSRIHNADSGIGRVESRIQRAHGLHGMGRRVASELTTESACLYESSLMRVDEIEKRGFVLEFFRLSCPGQTRRKISFELMGVKMRVSHF